MTAQERPKQSTPFAVVYGVYAWTAFVIGLSAALGAVLIVPGLERRRRWVGRCARSFFVAAGIRASVRGIDRLPEGPCVAVANHASYLDGVILQAYLPPRFTYVIKSEMKKIPVAHFFLRRIGARFVERFSKASGARDARRLMRDADGGTSLAFFPEGTFIATPGLGKFYLGAFVTASKSALPVVPVVIAGSRSILPAGRVLPSRGSLTVEVLEPLPPTGSVGTTPRALADAARRRMLAALPEPDLVAKS